MFRAQAWILPDSRTQAMSFVQLEMRAALAQILRNEAAHTCCSYYTGAVTTRTFPPPQHTEGVVEN